MNKQTRWFLVSSCGVTIPLHHTMISLGKEGCDVVLQSRSIDQRHALVTYDHYEKRFKVKDLDSINGTYLNEVRIPSHTFVKLEHLDSLRFGFDVAVYQVQVVEQVPIAVAADYRFRPWEPAYAYPPMKMADCQACLHKQTIPHTCGVKTVEWGTGPGLRAEQLCIENPSRDATQNQSDKQDYCGNILSPHQVTWTTTATRSSLIGTLLENGQCCHHSANATAIAGQQGSYPVPLSVPPNSQMHSNHPLTYTCCTLQNPFQRSGPSATAVGGSSVVVGMDSSPTISPFSSQLHCPVGVSPTESRVVMVGGSSNNSLQSTFSGDSLDLTHEDAVVCVQRRDMGRSASLNFPSAVVLSDGSTLPVENGLGVEVSAKCVTSAVITGNANADHGSKPKMETNVIGNNAKIAEKSYVPSLKIVGRAADAKDQCRVPEINEKDGVIQEKPEDKSVNRPNCMAFTIDFNDDRPPSSSAVSKKLDIKDSISKFAPSKALETEPKIGHRRNLSFPKSFMTTRKRVEGEGIPEELDSPTMGVIAAANAKLTLSGVCKAGGGYHSEGHVSSDQDDDTSAKSDPAKPATDAELDKLKVDGKLSKRTSPTKKGWSRHSLPVAGLRDSAKYLINKMFGEVHVPTNSPTEPLVPSVQETRKVPHSNTTAELAVAAIAKNDAKTSSLNSLVSNMIYTVEGRETGVRYRPGEKDVQIQEIVFSDEEEDDNDQEVAKNVEEDEGRGDEVCSEAGTYTIENEQGDTREETEARRNIDSVFGITDHHFQRPVVDGVEVDENIPVEFRGKRQGFTQGRPLAISQKGTPGWLKEWVALTASASGEAHFPTDQASNGDKSLDCAPPLGQKEKNRPRRKLPVPPIDRAVIGPSPSSVSLPSSDKLDSLVDRVPEKLRASSSSTSPEGRRSDSSMDTETILKETETVVSAMEARMDHQRQSVMNVMGISVESRDSGGESDVDTSTASATNEADDRCLAPSLNKNAGVQLKLLQSGSRSCAVGRDSRPTASLTHARNFSSREGTGSVGRTTPNSEYMDNSEVETASIHSDVSSSSDLSGSSPGSLKHKVGEKPPLMRFNRAFSLRRARLGCDSDGSTHSAPTPKTHLVPAQPSSRPGSAGSASSSRDRTRRSSTSNRSDSGASASSVPPTKGPPSASNTFNRADGGRFSLRLPRGPPVGKPAAKNPSSVPASRSKAINAPPTKATVLVPPRSNSTLSAKELEMKNWKRRKGYDPLKAAAEGRKKEAAKKVNLSKSEILSPTPGSFQRSASFHGTDGLIQLRRNTFTSEDDIALSVAESALASQQLQLRHTIPDAPCLISEADVNLRGRIRKSSEDESVSEATRAYSHTDLAADVTSTSPRGSPMLHPVHRHKIEALDNLVISTIHQVSSNLRSSAEGILKKLGEVHIHECHQMLGADGLQDLLARVSNAESPVLSPQNRSISRQLSGILKNMKRLEESMQVIDKVLSTVPCVEVDRFTERIRKDFRNGNERKTACNSVALQNKWNGFPRA